MINIIENFVELVDIISIKETKKYVNMTDISIEDDESFLLSSGIVSHNSAMGSILQKRDTKTDGVYRLKGKIKNVRSVSDLSSNQEVIELMQILDLDLDPEKRNFSYKRVIIATDADCLHESTKILTEEGIKQLSNLHIGDKVLTHNNTFEEVVFVTDKYFDDWIEIELDGDIFKCSPEHLWVVYRAGKIQNIEAQDLRLTDFFIKNLNSADNKKRDSDEEENQLFNM